MAEWRKSQKKDLKESQSPRQLDMSSLFESPFYRFASQVTTLRNTGTVQSSIKQAMLKDHIVTQIIDMWISDTLTRDVVTNEIFTVKVDKNNDSVSDDLISEIKTNIDFLRENSNLEEQLDTVLYNVITEGITSVRLGFVDLYEDTKIKLFESNKKRVLKETESWDADTKKKLLEAPSYDDYEEDTASYLLKNKETKNRLLGRYYIEILPNKLVPLKHKGITILYLDLNNTTKVLSPNNITTFVNTRGGVKTLSIKNDHDDIESSVYEIPLGKSFIEHAVTPWSLSNTVQDCTILALMTRSSIYRLFMVDVGAMDTQATDTLLTDLKKRLTTRETFDIRSQHYSSAQTQVPLGDSIMIPVRNGLGSVSVESIGGDLNIQTEGPMKFFRQEFLASLGIAESLVYGEQGGALINTSATRSDIRYLRTIKKFTSILSLGLEGILKDFLKMAGFNLSDISLSVVFSQLNSEESIQKIEFEQRKQEALDRLITSLGNLGIDFKNGGYIKTRDRLISNYMDEDLLTVIREDEEVMGNLISQPVPEENTELDSLPPMSSLGFEEPQLGDFQDDIEEIPEDVDSGELVEPISDEQVSDEPPFSIG